MNAGPKLQILSHLGRLLYNPLVLFIFILDTPCIGAMLDAYKSVFNFATSRFNYCMDSTYDCTILN